MEMHILSEFGRMVRFDPKWTEKWGTSACQEVFEACGSPREWSEFVRTHAQDPLLDQVRVQYEATATALLRSRARRVPAAVVLPDF